MDDNQERRLWWIVLGAAMTGSAAGKRAFEGLCEIETPSTEISLLRLAMKKEDREEAKRALGVEGNGNLLDAVTETLKRKVVQRKQKIVQSQLEFAAKFSPPDVFIKWLREKADALEKLGQ